jgi:general L-amino acid transport system substrate-binding protein
MNKVRVSIAAGLILSVTAAAASATTLDDVKKKGFVQCGVNTGLLGFAAPDDAGEWTGFDVDYCRAIAAAIFNDPKKAKFTPLTAKDRFTALQSGEIDVLTRNTTWTMARDTAQGMTFAGINYYDGEGFMVRESLGISSALELTGASICVQKGTTHELNLGDFFKLNKMTASPVIFDTLPDTTAAYDSGRCDAITVDASALYSIRLVLTTPDEHVILPEIISKEPLGPVVRQGDDQWANIVKWTHFALINAEELGVTQANVDNMKESENQDIRRLVGADPETNFGKGIGLENDWAANIIRAVGNYGEVFDRNIGAGSKLQIARGLNALWSKGGIQYAPPIR